MPSARGLAQAGLVLMSILIAVMAAAEDAESRTISNAKCVALAGTGLAFQGLRALGSLDATSVLLGWVRALDARLASPIACIAFAVALIVVLAGAEFAIRRHRGAPGLGFGDIKYLGAWAIILGPHVALALAGACLLGAAWALVRHERDFAFAPWIGIACAATLIALSWPM